MDETKKACHESYYGVMLIEDMDSSFSTVILSTWTEILLMKDCHGQSNQQFLWVIIRKIMKILDHKKVGALQYLFLQTLVESLDWNQTLISQLH